MQSDQASRTLTTLKLEPHTPRRARITSQIEPPPPTRSLGMSRRSRPCFKKTWPAVCDGLIPTPSAGGCAGPRADMSKTKAMGVEAPEGTAGGRSGCSAGMPAQSRCAADGRARVREAPLSPGRVSFVHRLRARTTGGAVQAQTCAGAAMRVRRQPRVSD